MAKNYDSRETFVNVHGITVGRVQHLAFYARTSPTPPTDKRGKHPNLWAMQDDIKKQIHAHIKSFPTIESHYCQAHTAKGRKYLSSYLSVAAMHELYLQKYEPEEFAKLQQRETANPVVKYEYYLQYFNTHFNLSFGTPKTDVWSMWWTYCKDTGCQKCNREEPLSGREGNTFETGIAVLCRATY